MIFQVSAAESLLSVIYKMFEKTRLKAATTVFRRHEKKRRSFFLLFSLVFSFFFPFHRKPLLKTAIEACHSVQGPTEEKRRKGKNADIYLKGYSALTRSEMRAIAVNVV